MPNPFVDESRDARLKVDVDGFCSTLRAPESIHRLVMDLKPAGFSVGDFALTSMVNDLIAGLSVRRDYRAIQGLLDTLFGQRVPSVTPQVPNGTPASGLAPSGTHGGGR